MVVDSDWIITDANAKDFAQQAVNDGRSCGLIPRNWGTHHLGCMAAAPAMPNDLLIPREEWRERLADQQATKSDLLTLRGESWIGGRLDSLDQDGYGYCWFFSITKACMYALARAGTPAVLSGWGAAFVKGFRNEGGMNLDAVKYITEEGIPLLSEMPGPKRIYDTPALHEKMRKRKLVEFWEGGGMDKEQNLKVMVTGFLLGYPLALDYLDIGHSMCGVKLVSLDPLTVDCDNSWTNSAGNNGIYRRTGQSAIPDAVTVVRSINPILP